MGRAFVSLSVALAALMAAGQAVATMDYEACVFREDGAELLKFDTATPESFVPFIGKYTIDQPNERLNLTSRLDLIPAPNSTVFSDPTPEEVVTVALPPSPFNGGPEELMSNDARWTTGGSTDGPWRVDEPGGLAVLLLGGFAAMLALGVSALPKRC